MHFSPNSYKVHHSWGDVIPDTWLSSPLLFFFFIKKKEKEKKKQFIEQEQRGGTKYFKVNSKSLEQSSLHKSNLLLKT